MSRYQKNKQEIESEIRRYSRTPAGRRLKFTALTAIAVSIVLLITIAFSNDSISPETTLLMRGCAGLCAIIFVVAEGLLVYRANHSLWHRQ